MRFAFSILLLFSFPAFAGDDCSSDAEKDINQCKGVVQAADQANKALADAGKKALASGQGECGVGGNQAGTSAPAADNMAKTKQPCSQAAQDCQQKCQQAEDRAKMRQQQGDPSAAMDIFKARENARRCSTEIPAEMARASAAQGTNTSDGVSGGNNTQSQSCTKKEESKPPQIPPIQPPQKSGGDQSPTQNATATPASTDNTAVADCASTNTCSLADGGMRTAFASPSAPKVGAQYAALSSGMTSASTGMSGISAPAAGGSGGGGSSSSSGSGSMGTASVNPNDKAAKDAAAAALKKALGEGQNGGKAPDNQFGTDGGGGGMGTASFDQSLADYLPGGAKDPTKAAETRKLAGATPPPAHPDIVGKSADLFGGVSKRMRLICDMKGFIGCN